MHSHRVYKTKQGKSSGVFQLTDRRALYIAISFRDKSTQFYGPDHP